MSIVRIGLGETKGYSEGYEAIFGVGKKGVKPAAAPAKKPVAKKPAAKATAKKPAAKKSAKKK